MDDLYLEAHLVPVAVESSDLLGVVDGFAADGALGGRGSD